MSKEMGKGKKVAGTNIILVPRGRAPFGQHQESRFLVLTKRSAASGDENGINIRGEAECAREGIAQLPLIPVKQKLPKAAMLAEMRTAG